MELSTESTSYIRGAMSALAGASGGRLREIFLCSSSMTMDRSVVCKFTSRSGADVLIEFKLPDTGSTTDAFFTEAYARIKLELSE